MSVARRGAEAGERRRDGLDAAAGDQADPRAVRAGPRRHDPPVGEERVGGGSEHPARLAHLRLHRAERLAVGVEVPPARPVGDPVQDACWRPAGLGYGLVGSAGDAPRVGHGPVRGEGADPQLGVVPRHVGVVPAHPRQALSVGGHRRRGGEVVALGQHDRAPGAFERDRLPGLAGRGRLPGAVQGHGDEVVDDLARGQVPLPHAHDPPPVGRDHRVGVAPRLAGRRLGSERLGRFSGTEAPQPLIVPVGGDQRVSVEGVAAAAILVDSSAGGEARRQQVGEDAVGAGGGHDLAGGVVGAQLVPHDPVAGGLDLSEPDGPVDQEVGGDRGRPAAVRSHGASHRGMVRDLR